MKLKTISSCIRKELNAGNYTKIYIIKGNNKPKFKGSSYCWKTKGGKDIFYPTAYHAVGWSNMIYHPSTLCIEVGHNYILNKYKKVLKYKKDPLLCKAFEIKFPILK